jgi:hypothetical protein
MAYGLQVVTSTLFDSLMRSNGGVTSRTRQILPIFIGDVLTLAVPVALGQAEVDHEDGVLGLFRAADEEVVWLYVAVDDTFFVDLFHDADELDGD